MPVSECNSSSVGRVLRLCRGICVTMCAGVDRRYGGDYGWWARAMCCVRFPGVGHVSGFLVELRTYLRRVASSGGGGLPVVVRWRSSCVVARRCRDYSLFRVCWICLGLSVAGFLRFRCVTVWAPWCACVFARAVLLPLLWMRASARFVGSSYALWYSRGAAGNSCRSA